MFSSYDFFFHYIGLVLLKQLTFSVSVFLILSLDLRPIKKLDLITQLRFPVILVL